MPEDKEPGSASEVTEKYKQMFSSDSEEVSEKLDVIKEEEEQPQPEPEIQEEQPQPEESVEEQEVKEEVTEEVTEEAPVEEEPGVRKIKADGKWHEVPEADVNKRLSMAIHAEQKLAGVNQKERELNQLIHTYNQAIQNVRKQPDISKEIPTTAEEQILSGLQKEEITEDDYDAPWKEKINQLIDVVNPLIEKNKQLENRVHIQDSNLYANELHNQFEEGKKAFEEEVKIKFPEENELAPDGIPKIKKIRDAVLMYYSNGLRVLNEDPQWFIDKGLPLAYTIRHAFYEWLGTQVSGSSAPQSLAIEELKKDEKLWNNIREEIFSEEAESEEKGEKIVQQKIKPPPKSHTEDIFEDMKEGESPTERVTEYYKKKYPNLTMPAKI